MNDLTSHLQTAESFTEKYEFQTFQLQYDKKNTYQIYIYQTLLSKATYYYY